MSKQRPAASRFLWDDEASKSSKTSGVTSNQRPGVGSRGFSTRNFGVDQSVNLMDTGGDKPVTQTETKTMRQSIAGLFRAEIGTSQNNSNFEEYGDAAPMGESEEYLEVENKRHRLSPTLSSFMNFCISMETARKVSLFCIFVGFILLICGFFTMLFQRQWYRVKSYQDIIVESNITPRGVFSAFGDNPQKQALHWLAVEDNSKLEKDHEALLERYILAVFYFSSEPLHWDKSDGWLTDNGHCSWYGVQCVPREDETEDSGVSKRYDDSDHITSITLVSNGVSGTIPPELGKLSNTLTVDLSDNRISGLLPEFHPNLRFLSLSKNKLVGNIPSSITRLTNLHGINLSNNRFEGKVSSDFGKLTELRYLMLSENRFSGTFPDVHKLTKMTKLHLDDNSFTGDLPTYIREFQRLAELCVGKNKLAGEFPVETLEALFDLEVLNIGNNDFSGTIPDFFDHIHRLTELHLNNMKLKGSIPLSLGHLSAMRSLRLDNNQLTGRIPDDMAIMADIEVIALNDNMLTGSIPSFIGVLDDVRYMSLKGNRLSGAIPSEIGHCFRLTDLHLQNNRLTGEIPSQLGKLDLLSKLSLQKNIFSNITMPAEICNLVKIGDISALSADCSDTSKVQCDCCHSCFPLS